MTSRDDFKWPESGLVSAPDWDPKPECGNGLHGLLWGEGDGSLLNWDKDAKWLVVEIEEYVDIQGKVKFPSGNVVFAGNQETATKYIADHGGAGKAIVGYNATAGERGTATAGSYGTATAGEGGTATAGEGGTATAGCGGTATAGHDGQIRISWWDGNRHRLAVGYVGEDGIEANVPYVVVNGKLTRKINECK